MSEHYPGLLTEEEMQRLSQVRPPRPQPRPEDFRPGRRLSKEELDEVQEKIAALCLEYNVGISGCGCCNSPWFDYVNADGVEVTEDNYSVGGARLQIPKTEGGPS
jgi:hypothetical protein